MGYNLDRAIVAQNSATAAATIVAALVGAGVTDAVTETFDEVRTHIFEGTLALADGIIEGQDVQNTPPARSASTPRGGGGNANDAGAGVRLKFGKYEGKTIAEVYSTDPQYVEWLAETSNNDFIKGKTAEYLASVG